MGKHVPLFIASMDPVHNHIAFICLFLCLICFYDYFLWQLVPAWLSCLPIKGDLIEAKIVHDQLCSMVERLNS